MCNYVPRLTTYLGCCCSFVACGTLRGNEPAEEACKNGPIPVRRLLEFSYCFLHICEQVYVRYFYEWMKVQTLSEDHIITFYLKFIIQTNVVNENKY